jgi:ubiquinone/menaquinone biosynthesis C-methylase UbiE
MDNSFDIIYGYAFVHHLEDLDAFFSEIKRCLKQDGICRFYDDAYSPIWHKIKQNILKPLQLYTHRKRGISPADLRATLKSGFKKEELLQIMTKIGFSDLFFKRSSFLYYFWDRGTKKLLNQNFRCLDMISSFIIKLDRILISNYHLFQRNQIRLVWGFDT